MLKSVLMLLFFGLAAGVTWPASILAQTSGDPERGAEVYRACVACHSLRPDVHLTGPSLAGIWGRQAGTVESFNRYSDELKASGIIWEAAALNGWLAGPKEMVPETYMDFSGIEDDAQRTDLIAFLREATAPDGAASVVEQGLIPAEMADGQIPPDLGDPPPEGQVTAVRHCGDTYHVTTADGVETPIWETNLRIKTDTSERGPEPGAPVLISSGMMGDRASLIFSSLQELGSFVERQC